MQNVRVSMVCMNSLVGETDANYLKHREYISKAAEAGSDILCFPELSLTGYAMPGSAENTLSLDSDIVSSICDLSAEHRMCICVGLSDPEKHISQLVVEHGRILGSYDKTHLGYREASVMRKGDSLPVFRTSKAVIGIQTCWEGHIPEISTTYALKGADIILMPHASGLPPQRRKAGWEKIVPARAYDNTVYCATCNQVGDNGLGTVFGGGCMFAGPRGEILCEDYSGECMLTADLDLDLLNDIRSTDGSSMKNLYFLKGRRPELYFN